ncbi:MAG: hypothetical protein Sylvanvirus9_1 [Sylvanvirus sp.]|uniref:Uncharacterized protein n=1 Tax=Sylvanvirus sp. TaxID=2487774 RepID=A0A3G5AJQ3_9VIRU|nr:MAG: hypothetical protein Sylvanvirus9_1 [Sylvanvirus sp.]
MQELFKDHQWLFEEFKQVLNTSPVSKKRSIGIESLQKIQDQIQDKMPSSGIFIKWITSLQGLVLTFHSETHTPYVAMFRKQIGTHDSLLDFKPGCWVTFDITPRSQRLINVDVVADMDDDIKDEMNGDKDTNISSNPLQLTVYGSFDQIAKDNPWHPQWSYQCSWI